MKPISKEDNFLAKIAGDSDADQSMMPETREQYRLNQIAERIGSSGSSSSLPTYSAEDAGKVLTVDSTGSGVAWQSGGGVFVVRMDLDNGTADKTFAETVAAFEAGQIIAFLDSNRGICVFAYPLFATPETGDAYVSSFGATDIHVLKTSPISSSWTLFYHTIDFYNEDGEDVVFNYTESIAL